MSNVYSTFVSVDHYVSVQIEGDVPSADTPAKLLSETVAVQAARNFLRGIRDGLSQSFVFEVVTQSAFGQDRRHLVHMAADGALFSVRETR